MCPPRRARNRHTEVQCRRTQFARPPGPRWRKHLANRVWRIPCCCPLMPRSRVRVLLVAFFSIAALAVIVSGGQHDRRSPPGPAADLPRRQLVESRYLDGASRSGIGRLRHLHRTDQRDAPRLRRRRLAGQRAGLRLSVRGRRRHRAAARRAVPVRRRERRRQSRDESERSLLSDPGRSDHPGALDRGRRARATSTCAATAIATCSSSIAIDVTCTSSTTSSSTAASGTPAPARSST